MRTSTVSTDPETMTLEELEADLRQRMAMAAKKKLPPWNRPITDADRRAARAAIDAERAGDDGAIFRFISTPCSDD
jgi:hypothetical protein